LVAPARWTTASTPSIASCSAAWLQTSPMAYSSSTPRASRALRSEVSRTRQRTWWPESASALAVWGPTKPVAPVSSTFTRSDLRLVDSVGLVPLAAHHLDRAVHEEVVLERPRDLAADVAELARGAQGVEVENRVDAALPVRLLDTQGDEAAAIDLPRIPEELEQADGKAEGGQSATDLGERLVEVGDGHGEGDRLALDLGDEKEIRHRQGLHALGDVVELLVRDWDEAPVLLPGRIVNLLDARHLVGEVAHVEGADDDALLGAHALGDPHHLLWRIDVGGHPEGPEVL